MVLFMTPPRRPIERTRKYHIWAEHRSAHVGPYQLVLQVIDELSGDGTMLVRAGYRKDELARPSQPTFEAERWVEVLEAAIGDETFFTDEQVARLKAACDVRVNRDEVQP